MKHLSIILLCLLICSFTTQPADERLLQDSLPKSSNHLWDIFAKAKITYDEKQGKFSASYPEEIKKLDKQEIELDGFMLPLEAEEKQNHFILSKRTPTCPFCLPGGPNEVIEVYTKNKIAFTYDLIKIKGKFELVDNPEKAIFFRITSGKMPNNSSWSSPFKSALEWLKSLFVSERKKDSTNQPQEP